MRKSRVQLFVAVAVFGEVALSLFVARAILSEILGYSP